MKIRIKLLLYLCTTLLAVFIFSFLFLYFITGKNETLLNKRLQETREINANNALTLNRSELKHFSYDYSVWDQLLHFIVRKKDTAWALNELDLSLFRYNIDYIWVLDNSARNYYNSAKNGSSTATHLNIPPDRLLLKLKENSFAHFYLRQNNILTEIYSAPVQPTDDPERKSEPRGYLLLGRTVDEKYIAALGSIAPELIFTLTDPHLPYTDSINSDHSSVSFLLPLLSLEGTPVANLKVERDFPVLHNYNRNLKLYLIAFLTGLCLLAVLLYQYIRKIIIKPLQQIQKALKKRESSPLLLLMGNKDEFGELSNLVSDSFRQSSLLKEEIEHRKKSESELKNALQEKNIAMTEKFRAEQSTLAKTQFLSTMSHEIRTPINGVIGIANLLNEEKLNIRQKEYVKTLKFSAEHLLSLVSDILDFSKIESGSFHLEKTSFNLETVCQNTFTLFRNKAEEKNIRYVFSPAEIKDYSLYGDPTRLSQVIANLLSNAVKFTEKGQVELSYAIGENDDEGVSIEFTVSDTGIGIPEKNLHRIFDSFSQADETITRNYGGTGLGLTISQKIIELQGGRIKVLSQEGKGSSFSFSLRFNKHVYTNSQDIERNMQKSLKKELPGMRILIAEDNPINAMVLSRFLKKWKIDYKVAKDGEEAISLLHENEFDIVLMDLQMPIIDGMEATRLIRLSDITRIKDVPIVAFTADALVETHWKLINNGFNFCITKPFNPDQLFSYLEKHYALAY